MRACAVWLHHQHTAEENLLDRTAVRKDDEYCALCSFAAAAVAIGQLKLQLSHYSLIALQAFCFPKCDFWGGLKKFFSRLAIARHIFRPPHKLCYNSTTGNGSRLSRLIRCCTHWIQHWWDGQNIGDLFRTCTIADCRDHVVGLSSTR